MRCRTGFFQIVLFALVFFVSPVLLAQEAPTQTFTSADGMFTMMYPDGWTAVEESDLIRFSSDEIFVQVSIHDYGEEVTPLEVLEIGAMVDFGYTVPTNLTIAGYSAVQSSGSDQLHTVINFCGGTLALIIGYVPPGQVAAYAPTISAMMDTIQWGDSVPVSCRGSFEELQPITAANAGGLAQITTLGDGTVPVSSVAFSPDGRLVAAGMMDGTLHIWSMVTSEEVITKTRLIGGATSVAFGSGGYNLVAGTGGGRVELYGMPAGDASGTPNRHSTTVESVAFTAEGFFIASGALDGSLMLADLVGGRSGEPIVAADPALPITSIAFSQDETKLAAGGGSTIRVWDVASATVTATLDAEISDILTLAFSPDSTMLIYGGADPSVWVWDLAGDTHTLLDGHSVSVNALAYSPDGTLIASGDANAVRVWDAATGEALAKFDSPGGQRVNTVAFSTNGAILASGSETGGIVIWGTTVAGELSQDGASGESPDTQATPEASGPDSACTVTPANNANLRGGPGTNFDRAGALSAGQAVTADGQTQAADGFTWYRLTDGGWVRGDLVSATAGCASIPQVTE